MYYLVCYKIMAYFEYILDISYNTLSVMDVNIKHHFPMNEIHP